MKPVEENGGHFYINNLGDKVPSVTTILGIISKPNIPEWSNLLGFKHIDYSEYMEGRAAIGTDFHKMLEDYASGKEINGEHYEESIVMFNRFLVWASNHYYKVLLHEESLVNNSFGGTVDAIAEVDGALTIIDYKTSKKIYPIQFVQLAGYSILISELMPETYKLIKAAGILSMRSTKSYKFITLKDLEKKYVPVFINAYRLYTEYNNILSDFY